MIIKKHSRRLASIVEDFTDYLGCNEEYIALMSIGAAFHDIGKLYIPEEILSLSRPLSKLEYEIVKRHAEVGYKVLSFITENTLILNTCRYHHERWDGLGYPDALREVEIPKESRIMAVCDSYEALTSKRHYKPAMTPKQALEVIRLETGSHFDPVLAERFVEFINQKNNN